MNYEENELEDYARYMDYIRSIIKEEMEDIDIEDKDIDFGYIDRLSICNLDDMSSHTWGFQYTIKKSGKNPMYFTKDMRYTKQIAYDEWKRLQKVETRNKIIDNILEGLEPKHKDILIEGLKKIDSI